MADTSLWVRKQARFTTAVFFILSGLLSASWSSRIPDMQAHLGVSNIIWGTVLFALPAGFIAGITVASWFTAHFGAHRIIVGGCLLGSILLFLLGMADNVLALMATLFFIGFVRTIFNIAVNTRSVEVQRLYEKPILSLFHGLWSFACFIAIGIGTLMITRHIPPFYHFLGIASFCIAFIFFFRKNPLNKLETPPEKRPLFVKPDRYLLLLGLIAFCAMLCESTIFDWSVNYFEKIIHAEKGMVTTGYTAFIMSMAAGRLFGDRLIERVGSFTLLKINGVLMGTGFLMAALYPLLLPAAFGLLLVGLGDSVIVPIVYNLSSKSKKMTASYALGAVTMVGYTGFLSGPLFVGWISDWLNMRWALGIVGVICFSIIGLTIKAKKQLALEQPVRTDI